MGGQEGPTSDSQTGDGDREQKAVGVDNSTDVGGPEQSEMEKSSVKATSSSKVTVKERVEVTSSSSRPERVKTPTKKAAARKKPQKSKVKAQKKAIAPGKDQGLPEGVTPETFSEDDALRSETGDEEEATEQAEVGDEEEEGGEEEEEGGGHGEQEEEEEEEAEEAEEEGPFVQVQTGNNVIDVVRRVLSDRTRRYMNREYLTAWEHCDEATWEPLVHFPNKLPVEQYWGSRGLSWKVELADKRRNGRCSACDEPITYDSVTVNRLMAKGYPYHLDCAFKDSNIRNSIGDYQDLVFFEELERRYRRRVGYNWKLFSASHKAAHHEDEEEAEDEDEEKRQKETASVPRKRKRSPEGQAPLHSKKRKPPAARPRRESPSTQSQDDQMGDEMVDVVDSYSDELGSDDGDGIHYQEGHSLSGQRVHEISEYSAALAQSAVERLNASRRSLHQASASLVPFNPMVGVSAGIVDMAKPAVSERQPAARPPQRPLPQAVSPAPTFASTEPLTELVITLSERLRDLETRLAQQGLRSPAAAAEPPSLNSIPTHVLAQELSRRLANPN